ncbi:f-box domain containing protein [Niveomyces insectorum RCEF 264]|uniref:F-box domain containing protein n=1 Tax=Niveomyces insectorum RCEF 264 TaxID=1081102 RepID=A0A167SHI4_9HYPO|nr:f-box domain containing protein [Niveomyces insectorum RCEF 264]
MAEIADAASVGAVLIAGDAGRREMENQSRDGDPQSVSRSTLSAETESKKRKPRPGSGLNDNDVSPQIGPQAGLAKRLKVTLDGHYRPSSRVSQLGVPADRSLLPAEIWHRVFTFCPPRTLGNLLRVNKLFNFYLDPVSSVAVGSPPSLPCQSVARLLKPNEIWQMARRLFWPNMPSPLHGKTELDMWCLCCSLTCQFCGKRDARRPFAATDPLRFGPGVDGVTCIWAFRASCCGSCLVTQSIKEVAYLVTDGSTFLMPALPFVFATPDPCIIPLSVIERGQLPPSLTLTKLFWSPDVESLRREFAAVKELGGPALEEWQKGLSTRGADQRASVAKWEKYADSGGVANMQTLLHPGYRSTAPPQHARAAAASSKTIAVRSLPSLALLPASGKHVLSPKTAAATGPIAGHAPHITRGTTSSATAERTKIDSTHLKAAKRVEIERRALQLDPSLTSTVLAQTPAFRAVVQIAAPLDDGTWELLKARLLAQVAEAAEKQAPSKTLPENVRPSADAQIVMVEDNTAKKGIDALWDEVQGPVRLKILKYADEAITGDWDDGEKVTKDNAPSFAADVLLHVRKRFYTQVVKDAVAARAAGRKPVVDPVAGPYTQKLTLENMKYVFDTKVKPLTAHLRKELFLCSACDYNSKFFGLEAVIQHYAAKHTVVLSVGSVVVYWRAEWPAMPPFKPNPRPPKGASHSLPAIPSQPANYQGVSGKSTTRSRAGYQPMSDAPVPLPPQKPAYAQGPDPPSQLGLSLRAQRQLPQPHQPPQRRQPPPLPNQNTASSSDVVSKGTDYVSEIPTKEIVYGPQAFPTTRPLPDSQFSHANHKATIDNTPGTSGPVALPKKPSMLCNDKAAEASRLLREFWNQTENMKNLPSAVRFFTVIHHLGKSVKSSFREPLSLTLLIDALSKKKMQHIRNADRLSCKACCTGSGYTTQREMGNKSFSFSHLLNHFQNMHMKRNPGTPLHRRVTLDWKTDMLLLPHPSDMLKMVGQRKRKLPRLYEAVNHLISSSEAGPNAKPAATGFATPSSTEGQRKADDVFVNRNNATKIHGSDAAGTVHAGAMAQNPSAGSHSLQHLNTVDSNTQRTAPRDAPWKLPDKTTQRKQDSQLPPGQTTNTVPNGKTRDGAKKIDEQKTQYENLCTVSVVDGVQTAQVKSTPVTMEGDRGTLFTAPATQKTPTSQRRGYQERARARWRKPVVNENEGGTQLSLRRIPSTSSLMVHEPDLLDALETHLNHVEGEHRPYVPNGPPPPFAPHPSHATRFGEQRKASGSSYVAPSSHQAIDDYMPYRMDEDRAGHNSTRSRSPPARRSYAESTQQPPFTNAHEQILTTASRRYGTGEPVYVTRVDDNMGHERAPPLPPSYYYDSRFHGRSEHYPAYADEMRPRSPPPVEMLRVLRPDGTYYARRAVQRPPQSPPPPPVKQQQPRPNTGRYYIIEEAAPPHYHGVVDGSVAAGYWPRPQRGHAGALEAAAYELTGKTEAAVAAMSGVEGEAAGGTTTNRARTTLPSVRAERPAYHEEYDPRYPSGSAANAQ